MPSPLPSPRITAVRNALRDVANRHPRVVRRGLQASAVVALLSVGGGAWLMYSVLTGLPNAQAIRNIGSMAQATTLYDVHDQPISTIFTERRIDVPLSRMSPHLVHAMLAIEDQRFYDHSGIDLVRVAGAAWMNVREGWGSQGASTITQQLARQSFLTSEKTLRRKLREIVLASRIEGEFTKDEILQLYLNKVYFGDGLYGAEAASLGYFGKHAADLDVAEAALLAGLVKAPSPTAPTVNLKRSVARRNAVLQAMRETGVLEQAAYEDAVRSTPTLVDTLRGDDSVGQYFREEVRKELVERFGWEQVHEQGLRVYTTMDLDMQKAAEAEVSRTIADIERRQRTRRKATDGQMLQAALVALDIRTGEVRALVGGRDYDDSRFNRATQAKRQPGSAFKPFVYAAALEEGFTPGTIIHTLRTPIMTTAGAWIPDDHGTEPTMTMRAALKVSSNRAVVSMLQGVGIPAAVKSAARLGIDNVPAVWSLALGSGEVTLLSMTRAYAAFGNRGELTTPTLIRRVETADGQVLFTATTTTEQGVSAQTAFLMTSMLSDVIDGGTAWQARQAGFTLPAAGKTGTTNDYHDAWFVGYTPSLATGVWIGYDQPRTIISNGYAGDLAVPLWGRFMAAATRRDEPERFSQPGGITTSAICRLTGKLATDACRNAPVFDARGEVSNRSRVYTEYFVRGTEPTEWCEHRHLQPGPNLNVGGPASADPVAALARPAERSAVAGPEVAAVLVPAEQTAPADVKDNEEREPPQPRKRGFWSKVFGKGR